MTETSTDDLPGFVAEEPEHCHDCYRLVRPGRTYYLTIEQAVVCPDCIGTVDAMRMASSLTVEVGGGGTTSKRSASPRTLSWRELFANPRASDME